MTFNQTDFTQKIRYPIDLYKTDQKAKAIDGGLKNVSDRDLKFFHENGYLVVNDAFDPTEVDHTLSAIRDLIDGKNPDFRGVQVEPKIRRYFDQLSIEDRRSAVRKIYNFIEYDHRLKQLFEKRDVIDVLRKMMDDDPIHLQDMALLKPPKIGSEKPWHQDCAYFNFPIGTIVIGVWIALDEATIENGCMHVIPKSHRSPTIHFKHRDWQICDTDVEKENAIAVPLDPGGCLFFHGLLHHGTPANFTDQSRRALQYHYRPKNAETITIDQRMEIFGSEGKNVSC